MDAEERFWAKVDKNGPVHPVLGTRCWSWLASKNKAGHGIFNKTTAHRFSWQLVNELVPPGLELDHRCQNPGCVNHEHLRVVTGKQNQEHRRGPQRNGSSGILGVSQRRGRWRAQIGHNGEGIHLGDFDTKEEAAMARRAAEDKYFTHHRP